MSRLRWSKMWWADWAGDNALSLCSLAAQGLWMRLLCLAAQNEPYGSILVGGRQPSEMELVKLIKPPIDARRFRKLLAELERRNVIKRDPDGTLFSSRMRADFAESARQSTRGTASWKARQNKGMPGSRFERENVVPLRPESDAEDRTPLKPPRRSRRNGKASGWTDIATDLAASGGEE